MFVPQSYAGILTLVVVMMLPSGFWANAPKVAPGWPFQSFYSDYALGLLATIWGWKLTVGGLVSAPFRLKSFLVRRR